MMRIPQRSATKFFGDLGFLLGFDLRLKKAPDWKLS